MTAYAPTVRQQTGLAIIVGLLLSVSLAVPAAQAQQLIMQISIDEVTFEEGLVTVGGTVTCSDPTEFTDVNVTVRQPVGRFRTVEGGRFESLGPCDGELSFSLTVAPGGGKFTPSKAYVFADTFACTPWSEEQGQSCDGDTTVEVVKLRK